MSHQELSIISRQWATVTEEGNTMFKNSLYTQAETSYIKAVTLSTLLTREVALAEMHGVDAAGAFSTSCINLSNTYYELQDLKLAGDYHLLNVVNLKKLSGDSTLTSHSRRAVKRLWYDAVLAMSGFYQNIGKTPEMDFWKDETYQQIEAARAMVNNARTNLN